MLKRFFVDHPEPVLAVIEVLLAGILVGSFLWTIQIIFTGFASALLPIEPTVETLSFDVHGAAKALTRPESVLPPPTPVATTPTSTTIATSSPP